MGPACGQCARGSRCAGCVRLEHCRTAIFCTRYARFLCLRARQSLARSPRCPWSCACIFYRMEPLRTLSRFVQCWFVTLSSLFFYFCINEVGASTSLRHYSVSLWHLFSHLALPITLRTAVFNNYQLNTSSLSGTGPQVVPHHYCATAALHSCVGRPTVPSFLPLVAVDSSASGKRARGHVRFSLLHYCTSASSLSCILSFVIGLIASYY